MRKPMEDDDYIDYSQPSLVQKRDSGSEKNMETEIIRNVLKNRFFEEMSKYNFDFDLISSGKRNKNEEFHKFNLFIRDMYEEVRILMSDMALFLEEDLFDAKTVTQCFNEENMIILREEFSIKFKRKKSRLEILIDD